MDHINEPTEGWKLIKTVTGKTQVDIPTNAKEIYAYSIYNSRASYLYIPTILLTDDLVSPFYGSGAYSNGDCRNARYTVNRSHIQLAFLTQDADDVSDVSSTSFYYR